tara:strand:+ start:2182 stop:2637 length:456 start_codon:yes stop_codon:yes gene_type:complete
VSWVRLATEQDLDSMSTRLREADKKEVEASGGYQPEEALRLSYESSDTCFAFGSPEDVWAMFGVTTMFDNVGAIWLLGTDAIDTNPIAFLRWSRRFLPFLLEPYDMVCNLVHAENTVHIKWLRWLGFAFIRKVSHGPKQLPFYEFARLSNV